MAFCRKRQYVMSDSNRKERLSDRTDDDPCTAYEERAAILEYCAGMTRAEAERRARKMEER